MNFGPLEVRSEQEAALAFDSWSRNLNSAAIIAVAAAKYSNLQTNFHR